MSNKKNLLIYAHYYIPDTASTGQILPRELAEGMLDKFNITVICVVPSYLGTIEDKYKTQKCYEEKINGVKVLRIRVPELGRKSQQKEPCEEHCFLFLWSNGGDLLRLEKWIMCSQSLSLQFWEDLLGVWGKWVKHAKYIYNIQDFNPEQVLAVDYTKNEIITGAMMWFDKLVASAATL